MEPSGKDTKIKLDAKLRAAVMHEFAGWAKINLPYVELYRTLGAAAVYLSDQEDKECHSRSE
jgi:hypothetical protein